MSSTSIHVEINGAGPDLVLLHGWALNLRVWDGLVEQLRGRFRLIRLDLPGHGRSPWLPGHHTPAEQTWLIHQTLATLSGRYALLGWSLGAQIALDLAAATPAQVAGLILVAATPKFAAAEDWPHGAAPAVLEKLRSSLHEDHRRAVSDFLDLQVRATAGGAAVLQQLRQALFNHGEADSAALVAALERLSVSDLRAGLAQVCAPAVTIAGEYDRITPPAATRALAAALPLARFIQIGRAAHAPFLSHPDVFAKLVREFLRSPRAFVQRGSRRRMKARARKKMRANTRR